MQIKTALNQVFRRLESVLYFPLFSFVLSKSALSVLCGRKIFCIFANKGK